MTILILFSFVNIWTCFHFLILNKYVIFNLILHLYIFSKLYKLQASQNPDSPGRPRSLLNCPTDFPNLFLTTNSICAGTHTHTQKIWTSQVTCPAWLSQKQGLDLNRLTARPACDRTGFSMWSGTRCFRALGMCCISELEILGWAPEITFNKLFGWVRCRLKCENHCHKIH